LLRPSFWVAFGVTVGLALYLYGLALAREVTGLARAKADVARISRDREAVVAMLGQCQGETIQNREDVARLTRELAVLQTRSCTVTEPLGAVIAVESAGVTASGESSEEVLRLRLIVEELRRQVARKNMELVSATRRIDELVAANSPGLPVTTDARDVAPDKRVPRELERWREPMVEGEQSVDQRVGRVVVFSRCAEAGDTTIWIDGRYAGIVHPGSMLPRCGGADGLSVVVDPGRHEIRTRDRRGRSAVFGVAVSEGECVVTQVACRG